MAPTVQMESRPANRREILSRDVDVPQIAARRDHGLRWSSLRFLVPGFTPVRMQ